LGDYETAAAAQRALDQDCGRSDEGGVLRYSKGSNLSNIIAVKARLHRRDDFRKAVNEGPPESALNGPILTGLKYPEVLVGRAFSNGTISNWCSIPEPPTVRGRFVSSVCVQARATRFATARSIGLSQTVQEQWICPSS